MLFHLIALLNLIIVRQLRSCRVLCCLYLYLASRRTRTVYIAARPKRRAHLLPLTRSLDSSCDLSLLLLVSASFFPPPSNCTGVDRARGFSQIKVLLPGRFSSTPTIFQSLLISLSLPTVQSPQHSANCNIHQTSISPYSPRLYTLHRTFYLLLSSIVRHSLSLPFCITNYLPSTLAQHFI